MAFYEYNRAFISDIGLYGVTEVLHYLGAHHSWSLVSDVFQGCGDIDFLYSYGETKQQTLLGFIKIFSMHYLICDVCFLQVNITSL